MKQSTWRVLAFGALMCAVALPASAQVVIGGSGTPSVEVNWSVLDNLGRQPTLADMLKSEPPALDSRTVASAKAKGVQYKPFKPGAKPYAKPAKVSQAAPKPKKSNVVPASAKSARMSDLVQSVHTAPAKPAPAVEAPKPAPVAEAPKPAAPAVVGPQITLPEVPKPAAATAPVQLAKAEPAPAPAPKVDPKPEPAPKVEAKAAPEPAALPPTALTPPPMPAKVEAPAVAEAPKVEAPKAELPPQVAALPPSPPPAAAVASRGGDTLSVPFSTESARLPDSVHGELDRLVKRLQKDDGLGLQLLAYAEGDDANASKARRLSLSRALEVRKYLMDQGIRSTRIEVRALGNKLDGGGSADRVDAVLVSR